MGLLDWLRAVLVGSDAGFLVRDGHELQWPRTPLGIFVAPAAMPWIGILTQVVRQLHDAIGRPFPQFPVLATPAMLAAFGDLDLSKRLTGSVLIEVGPTSDPLHGSTQHDYDTRTGEIRSAFVRLPGGLVDPELCWAVAFHELGHVLGLDHDARRSSIMFPVTSGRGQSLSAADASRLRKAYG